MINPNDYTFRVRADFSMVALDKRCPAFNGKQKQNNCCGYMSDAGLCLNHEACKDRNLNGMCGQYFDERNYDRKNSADDGYRLSGQSKIKIRAAANALFMSKIDNRDHLRFVTFTFPTLPDSWVHRDLRDQDQFLYGLFKRFLNNERNNYDLLRYLWVNERQERGTIHFHCLFEYKTRVDYAETNIRFLNLLRRNGFNIYSRDFLADSYAHRRDVIGKKLSELDYKWFSENKRLTYYRHTPRIIERRGKKLSITESSVFLQPVDFAKPIDDVVRLSYYLSKYISKDDVKEKIFCRRWASSRGLAPQKDTVFEEFDNPTLVEIYKDYSTEEKKKGGYNEKELKPMRFEYQVNDKTYIGWYFPPTYRKWANDPSMVEYFRDKFNYYLTN